MNDDELKKIWRQQELKPPTQVPDSELVTRMKKKMRKFDRTIFWRDRRELVACAVVFVAFLFFLLHPLSMLMGAGCVALMLASVFIGGKLVFSRRKHHSLPETVPLGDYLRAELAKVKCQAQLLRSVWWWYLLPLFIGVELFSLGLPRSFEDQIVSLAVNFLVFGVVYWVNLYAVRKSLMPLIQELEQTLNSVNEFSSPTDPANPNP